MESKSVAPDPNNEFEKLGVNFKIHHGGHGAAGGGLHVEELLS